MSKFRSWDSEILADAVKISVQIRAKIEEMCITTPLIPEATAESPFLLERRVKSSLIEQSKYS